MRTPLFFGNISYYLSYTIILDTTFQIKNQVVLSIFAVLYKFYIKFNKNDDKEDFSLANDCKRAFFNNLVCLLVCIILHLLIKGAVSFTL